MEFGWLLQGAVNLIGQLPSWLRDPRPGALAVIGAAASSSLLAIAILLRRRRQRREARARSSKCGTRRLS